MEQIQLTAKKVFDLFKVPHLWQSEVRDASAQGGS